jgi:LPPG:FO 2-phospho-L-lactate transferase
VDGLDQALPSASFSAIVNTGDDFEHWGLHISPDLDTIMYTLAGLSPVERGWGIEGDTFSVLEEAQRRGIDDWFRLGDRDLVTHLARTAALHAGTSLSDVTRELCQKLGVERPIFPMSDEPRPTTIVTDDGRTLPFQEWLVKARAAPAVRAVLCGGSNLPARAALEAIQGADLVVICPSNPFVSIDPILSLDGIRDAVRATPTVAVSPILNGSAVKGPLASMIPQIGGRPASAEAVAAHYGDLLDAFVVHHGDAFDGSFPMLETNILIQSREDRLSFARELLHFAEGLR